METNKRGVTVFLFLASFLFAVLPASDASRTGTLLVAGVFYGVICGMMGPAFYVTQPLISFGLCLLLTGDAVTAGFSVLSYAAIGAVCGVCFRKQVSFQRAVFFAAFAAAAVSALSIGAGAYLADQSFTTRALSEYIANHFESLSAQYQTMLALQKIPAAQIGQIMVTARNMYIQMFPAIILVSAMVQAAITTALCGFICGRIADVKSRMNKIAQFQVGQVGAVFFFTSLLSLLFVNGMWSDAMLNVAIVTGAPLLLQGFLTITSLWKKIPGGFNFFLYMGIFWLVIFMNPAVLATIIALLGVADSFANLRKLPLDKK